MTDAPHRVVFTLEYEDERTARIVSSSLAQEIGEIDNNRSTTTLSRNSTDVSITVDAMDLVALRAAMNTWLSLAGVAERVVESIDF